ncbi:MAG: hypothetical protein F4137_10285 [Acidobacteria bacterium]|nr:hypothetical protein [Acidobacteriota bacterium]
MRVVVVGSGFAGSILARVARVAGHDVTLVERASHPRFALGESSTPLAAIALERLAARYGLDDLHALAACGRWSERVPELRRGLKRGFTFYRHARGRGFENDASNRNRLLVAASPDDAVADAQWLREDVDTFLVRRAEAAGVRYLDRTVLDGLERRAGRFHPRGARRGAAVRLEADLIVDASGPGGFLARQLGLETALPRGALRTGLVYGHFRGVQPLRRVANAAFPAGPYPDELAAVHHLLDEGWMYELTFDHGVVSAGFVIEGAEAWRSIAERPPADAFRALTRRYPSLAAQYEAAAPVRPVAATAHLQRRLSRAAGEGWALLPHVLQFWSPLFSTGIAWSLLGVERLGLLLESAAGPSGAGGDRLTAGLERYDTLLRAEADHLRRLIEPAYRCRRDFDAFDAYTQAYFAAASYSETLQRLRPAPPETGGHWAWSGFLGATDPVLQRIFAEAARLAEKRRSEPLPHQRPLESPIDAMRRLIAPRNLAGLADPARRRLYPVDLEALVAAAGLLGLTADEMRARLPLLRGEPGAGD